MAYQKVPRPSTVYHLTQKGNLDSILDDGMIRRFNDTECWFCESLDKMRAYMAQTVLCEGKSYYAVGGQLCSYPKFVPEDYVLLKLTPRGYEDVFNAVQQLIQKRKETFSRTTTQNIYPLTSRIQCSECGSFYRRRSVSGTVKWVCALHKDDSTACDSHYYSEERIYDGFITMVNKLRFSEDNILGQVISRLEMTLAAMKRNNLVARDLSNRIPPQSGIRPDAYR